MRLGRFTKTPNEVKRYRIEYADWLDTGEFVSAVTFTQLSGSGTITLAPGAIPGNNTSLPFVASGGTSGVDYEVSVRITTTGNQVKEDSMIFSVRAL